MSTINNSVNNTSYGITVTGTANINTTGSAVTSINTGGTGVTNIGNATGNTAVTGSLTTTTTLTATAGAITTTNGDHAVGNTAAASTAPFLNFLKSRSGGVITTGDVLGEIDFKGHDGTQYITGARIVATTFGTIATNRIPTQLFFYTHANSTATAALALTLDNVQAGTFQGGLTVVAGGATITAGGITITAGGMTITDGSLILSAGSGTGNINLPINSSSTQGAITGILNTTTYPLLHYYGSSVGYNTFVGLRAGNTTLNTTNARFNTGVGSGSTSAVGSLGALTTGAANVGLGYQTLNSLTSGSSNTALGTQSLLSLVSGSYNFGIGNDNIVSGGAYTGSESSNICIANVGVNGESNALRIGTAGSGNGQQNACYIAGISGVTVTGTAVLCATNGQLGTIASSERFKENIKEMGDASDKIMNLRPVVFNFKDGKGPFGESSNDKSLQYGLIAEEVDKIMPDLVVYDDDKLPLAVKYHDLPALLLNEIQKLYRRVEFLEDQLKGKEY